MLQSRLGSRLSPFHNRREWPKFFSTPVTLGTLFTTGVSIYTSYLIMYDTATFI